MQDDAAGNRFRRHARAPKSAGGNLLDSLSAFHCVY